MPLRTNADRLVRLAVLGEVDQPFMRATYRVSPDGEPKVLPCVGGITLNVLAGDPAAGWQADHVEPGVSLKFAKPREPASDGLNLLAQIGNDARVVSGAARGARGTVTGKHGGIEHVLVDFPRRALERMTIGDKVQIVSHGLGLELLDFPGVKVRNLDPRLVRKLGLRKKGRALEVPVAAVVPAALMGSGLGQDQTFSGDYDIQLFDAATVRRHGLEGLRLGDLVAIIDADHTYGRIWRAGSVAVGVVVHTDCTTAGHGPGVCTVLAAREGKRLAVRVSRRANIADILKIGRRRGR